MSEYPNKTKYAWVSSIRKQHILVILAKLMFIYVLINLFFAALYLITHSVVHTDQNGMLVSESAWYNYIYYSFISAFTIGYGDLIPKNIGKVFVICQSSCTTVYFALMVSILSIKLFYPGETIKFSKKVIYNSSSKELLFRIINTNREPLINPELRISITQHTFGNVIAGNVSVPDVYRIPYLGKHDFTYSFPNFIKVNTDTFNVYDQKLRADDYNKKTNTLESRFRITISITGSYGMQQVAMCKKYYANEIEIGEKFKAINYNEEDQRKNGEIRYSKFPDFWNDFNFIIK